ncbi:hypothetical protein MJO28_007459 [Puccinia striiformis f. sp. tritici]|uniref:Uncharacterized protein n=1 Tax=Puccinia striiformis f. sp. tritici TaxID=168172 RepID=A0ACC0EFH4_9BASI|nr:hypothetical protein Pst134EB_014560 [Puccinia striiformis f. sp. tritici]KAI7951775.1 hypothetical protein MJO28_007459 [Puccinia striiformis f. sp. tritici]
MLQQSITSQSLNRVDPHTSVVPIIDPSRPRTKVYKVPDRPALPTPPFISPEEYESQYSTESVPIVIDNGSCSIRAGYGSMSSPYIDTDSVVSRYRDRKTNRTIMLAGTCSYVDTNSRSNARPLHEEGVVCNYDTMEVMLDYVFLNLGVNADTVQHPILMSEALCNPVYTRGLMSELLFETYQTPSVCYGVDSLFSYHETHHDIPQSQQTSLVISSSHSSTTIIPVIAGIPHIAQSRRLNWGGLQESEFLLRLMQVKYSTFPSRMTPFQAFDLVQDHCLFSADAFQEDIRKFNDPDFLAEANRVIQFPFSTVEANEKTEAELTLQAERKRQSGLRLQEQTSRIRMEKLLQKEADLEAFQLIQSWKSKESKAKYQERLSMEGFDNEEELETLLKKTQLQLKKARNKDLGIDEEAEKGEPSFPLVDTPDHQLDEEGLKEKRRQKLMKAGHDARERAKSEREAEKSRQAEIERRDEEERLSNPNAWLAKVRTQYENLLVKIKERKKRRIQLSDRKSLAAQQRMKTIANLASDQPPGKTVNGNKKRKKTNDDTFGADDADWAVYRDVVGADESADEEDDLLELITVEKQLLEHDELFTIEDTRERQKLKRHCLMNAFYKGISPSKDDSSTIMAALDTEGNAEQSARLHINIERIRVPEPLYQPLLAGVDQAGLVEVVQYVLKEFSQDVQDQLTQHIYLTGGHITLPNFDVRLWNSLRPILPMNSPCNIFRPNLSNQEIRLLPWKGMAKFSSSPEFLQASITKQAYLECGNEYLMEHRFSNKLNF